jgi:hypothetical protein
MCPPVKMYGFAYDWEMGREMEDGWGFYVLFTDGAVE